MLWTSSRSFFLHLLHFLLNLIVWQFYSYMCIYFTIMCDSIPYTQFMFVIYIIYQKNKTLNTSWHGQWKFIALCIVVVCLFVFPPVAICLIIKLRPRKKKILFYAPDRPLFPHLLIFFYSQNCKISHFWTKIWMKNFEQSEQEKKSWFFSGNFGKICKKNF